MGSAFLLHDNDEIQTFVGEGISRVFCFPEGTSNPGTSICTTGGIDHLFLFDIGTNSDSTVSSASKNEFPAVGLVALVFVLTNLNYVDGA